ncbi:MAG: ATP-binding protein [Candidatus Altiarchaeota archaeon]|nr:ATP-binding protein [Candidatus Altiarchaeota archaeon]
MDAAGMVIASEGRNVSVLVKNPDVEVGSILRIGDSYGIVAGMLYQEDEKIGSKQRLLAEVQVFGRLSGKRLKKLKRPIAPYEAVSLAGKEELEQILSAGDSISIGLVYGTKARAFLNAGEYDRHIAVLASTGAGKSYTTACIIKEFSRLGLPVVVVDTHGEYQKLLSALSAETPLQLDVHTVQHRRQGFPELKIPVSQLEPDDFNHFIYLTEPQESALGIVLDKLSGEYVMDDIIAEAGRLDTQTIHEGTIQALKRKLITLGRMFRNVFDKCGTDISKLVEPGKITLIDTSLASQGVRRAVISYVAKEILEGRINAVNRMEGTSIGYPLLFVVEEAHNYAGAGLTHSCKRQLQRIASEGRKFGVGLCVISQKPSKIDEEILSQCNTGIYMHITNPNDKTHIRNSFESINDAIISELDGLDVGESIIAGAMLDIPFLLCTVDHIKMPSERASKFNFKRPVEEKKQKFEYV